jgi:hypothetical protein
MRILMVDWSGRKTRPEQSIALAEVEDGVLCRVEKGRDREAILLEILNVLRDGKETFIGFDFAFSLPAWFLVERDWTVADLWSADTEAWLTECSPPFWGRPGVRKPPGDDDFHLRMTDQRISVNGIRPKSVFQIGGAGSVGSGSLRGFWLLPRLQQAGAAIWPFESARRVTVAEVYPRAFTGPVVKAASSSRAAHLRICTAVSRNDVVEQRMVADEDCFDAGCTAMGLWLRRDQLRMLRATDDSRVALEGEILTPECLENTSHC